VQRNSMRRANQVIMRVANFKILIDVQ